MKLIDPLRLLSNFIKETSKYIANGRPQVTPLQYKERLDICNKCEHLRRTSFSCGLCGCYLGTKAKWATTKCPDKPARWSEIEEK